MNLDQLSTEQQNPISHQLDTLPPLEIAQLMNKADAEVPAAIQPLIPHLAQAIELISRGMKEGGRLIYLGAGTSGRLGVLDAAECVPTFGTHPEQVQGIIAGGKEAMFHAVEGAEDNEELAVRDLKALVLTQHDTLVGIAASGRTPYVIGGLRYAQALHVPTVAVACTSPAAISRYADISIEAVVGPEILTGSTRLKAGSAQKMILNILSTGSMICLGKVYDNLMVDVQATNLKLVHRAQHIVTTITGASQADVIQALESSDYRVKVAIVMLLKKCSVHQATQLVESYPQLREALQHEFN